MRAALVLAILASFLFALMNALAKFLSASMSVAEIVFYRGALGVILTLIMMRRSASPFKVYNWPLLISRGLFGAASLLMAFFAISKIALADASFLAHLSPVFTVWLGATVLKERMPQGFSYVLVLTCLGALLVANPWNLSLQGFYVAIGVFGALLASSASIAIRQLSKDHNNYTIMLAFLSVATFLPVPFIRWEGLVIPQGTTALAVFVMGTISFLAQYCLTQAYRLGKAGFVATSRYSGILFNIALGYIFWNEIPSEASLLGGFLILVGCVLLTRLPQVPDLPSTAR